MFKNIQKKLNSKRGFSLIELIVVIAIIGILVMLAAPRFLGYTKDANAAAMKADAKILSDASLLYNIEHDGAWPVGTTIVLDDTTHAGLIAALGFVDSDAVEAAKGATPATFDIFTLDSTKLSTYVKGLKGTYAEYALITIGVDHEGEVVHLKGVEAKNGTVWFGTQLNDE